VEPRQVTAAAAVRVELDHRINFAMQQNDVPVVQALHVVNQSDEPLRDLRVRISAEPEFAETWEARIDFVAAGSIYNLDAVDLVLSPTFLGELTERVHGQLRITLRRGEDTFVAQI